MNYDAIRPPLKAPFREMNKKELRAYAAWFHDVSPLRIAALASAVRNTPRYEKWEPNFSPESLQALGEWLEGQVTTRKSRPEELEEIRSNLAYPVDIPEDELTDRTLSLALDIGLYFGQVVVRNLPGTRWEQPLGSKKFVDYGQPVIVGFGADSLNPVSVLINVARNVADQKPAKLRELFDTWARFKQ